VSLLPAAAAGQDRLKVAVSIPPQAYFVERVGGDSIDVEVLVGPGQSPHTYEPTPKQIAALSQARAYFTIGVESEKALLPRIRRMFEGLEVIDTRTGVPVRMMAADEAEADERTHGPEEQHGHASEGRPDPHIWLSPTLVKIQAQTICDTLARLDAHHAEQYRRNLAAFHVDLDRIHARLAETLAPLKGREILVFHPAYGYFTDEFGLRQVPVEIEGKEPTAQQLAQLIERAKAARAKVIFVQPQFSRRSAEAVAKAIGGVVVPLDPLARDYLKNLEDLANRIKAGLSE
jgi:zinc transport system substrate-binding protein